MDESRDLLADDQSKVKQRVVQRLVFTFTVDKISSLRYSVSDENRRRPLLLLLLLLSAFNSARSGKAANVLGNSYKCNRNVLSFWTLPVRCLVYKVQQEDCSTPEVLGQVDKYAKHGRCLVYKVQQEDCSTPEVLGQICKAWQMLTFLFVSLPFVPKMTYRVF